MADVGTMPGRADMRGVQSRFPSEVSETFDRAVGFTRRLHCGQRRKLSGAPYLCHLLEVSGLVMSHGGDEPQVVAALLHDAIEDQSKAFGGAELLRQVIATEFGAEVLNLVNVCSDCEGDPKPPWAIRKRQHIERLRLASAYECLVPACDKLYNARCLNSELRAGLYPFLRLKADLAEQLWHLSTVAEVFADKDVPVADDLRFEVARLEEALVSQRLSGIAGRSGHSAVAAG